MSIKKYKGAKGKADVLFSKIIRHNKGCQRCGSRNSVQCSHIVSRRFSNTRTDTDNAQALCAKCHQFFTTHPVEFGKWVFSTIGEEKYNQLKRKSEATTKVDWDNELARLQDIYNNLQADWITD
jgi:5-methylcytosine-specific restriction endonuclease McrA